MRAVIRKEVDVDQPLNLRRLSPLQKITVSLRKEWKSTSFYRNADLARERVAHQKKIAREEDAKRAILGKVYTELIRKADARKDVGTIDEVIVAVDASFGDILFDRYNSDGELLYKGILNHSDFAQYDIEVIQENHDIRLAFPHMQYLLRFRKKVVQ